MANKNNVVHTLSHCAPKGNLNSENLLGDHWKSIDGSTLEALENQLAKRFGFKDFATLMARIRIYFKSIAPQDAAVLRRLLTTDIKDLIRKYNKDHALTLSNKLTRLPPKVYDVELRCTQKQAKDIELKLQTHGCTTNDLLTLGVKGDNIHIRIPQVSFDHVAAKIIINTLTGSKLHLDSDQMRTAKNHYENYIDEKLSLEHQTAVSTAIENEIEKKILSWISLKPTKGKQVTFLKAVDKMGETMTQKGALAQALINNTAYAQEIRKISINIKQFIRRELFQGASPQLRQAFLKAWEEQGFDSQSRIKAALKKNPNLDPAEFIQRAFFLKGKNVIKGGQGAYSEFGTVVFGHYLDQIFGFNVSGELETVLKDLSAKGQLGKIDALWDKFGLQVKNYGEYAQQHMCLHINLDQLATYTHQTLEFVAFVVNGCFNASLNFNPTELADFVKKNAGMIMQLTEKAPEIEPNPNRVTLFMVSGALIPGSAMLRCFGDASTSNVKYTAKTPPAATLGDKDYNAEPKNADPLFLPYWANPKGDNSAPLESTSEASSTYSSLKRQFHFSIEIDIRNLVQKYNLLR